MQKNKPSSSHLGYSILYDFQMFQLQRFGGISRYFCEIIHRMSLPYDIAVRYSKNYYLSAYHLGKHRIPLPHFVYNLFRRHFERKNRLLATKLIRNSKNYIFHPTYYNFYFLDYIGNNPFVITVHDMIHEKFSQYIPNANDTIFCKAKVIPQAARIIAISENTKKDIIDILHIDPEKIDVIYHSTSMKPVTHYKLKLPERFLLYVGDRTSYKNFERFVRVFSLLSKEDPSLHAVCTDRKFNASELELMASLHIQDRIRLIKASDRDLSELYCRAKLFVYPSLYEGFGIPILEAYACHCPVVLSNTSCFPEIAGEAGCYFDPYSEESMTEAIRSVLYDEEKRQRLIKAGDERLKLYSWEKAAKQTEAVYRKVINEYYK